MVFIAESNRKMSLMEKSMQSAYGSVEDFKFGMKCKSLMVKNVSNYAISFDTVVCTRILQLLFINTNHHLLLCYNKVCAVRLSIEIYNEIFVLIVNG